MCQHLSGSLFRRMQRIRFQQVNDSLLIMITFKRTTFISIFFLLQEHFHRNSHHTVRHGLWKSLFSSYRSNHHYAWYSFRKLGLWILIWQVSCVGFNWNFHAKEQPIFSRFGRKNPLVWAVILQFIAGVAAAFMPWLPLVFFMRFLSAMATGGTMVTSFVLVMELIGTFNSITWPISIETSDCE